MIRGLLSLLTITLLSQIGWSQESAAPQGGADASPQEVIRDRLTSYIETFNQHEASAVGAYWATDGVSVIQESGERTEGRDAIQEEFSTFFKENPDAHLSGEITNVRMIRPEIAQVEGETHLFLPGTDPVTSLFTAILTLDDGQWLISSSHESSLPTPETSYDALKELEWMVGTWEDQSDDAQVTTEVRWSPNEAFLIRSYNARFGEEEFLQGTQIIGWDPLDEQIRTWTFSSDGSFGQGTLAKHDDQWTMKMWEILGDGQVATATKVLSPSNDGTFSIQTIGETLDGVPMPTSDEVLVVRVAEDTAENVDIDMDEVIEDDTDIPTVPNGDESEGTTQTPPATSDEQPAASSTPETSNPEGDSP